MECVYFSKPSRMPGARATFAFVWVDIESSMEFKSSNEEVLWNNVEAAESTVQSQKLIMALEYVVKDRLEVIDCYPTRMVVYHRIFEMTK